MDIDTLRNLSLFIVLITFFSRELQASSDHAQTRSSGYSLKTLFSCCHQDAALDNKQEPTEIARAIIQDLDGKFPAAVTDLIIANLADPNQYVQFNINTVWENYKRNVQATALRCNTLPANLIYKEPIPGLYSISFKGKLEVLHLRLSLSAQKTGDLEGSIVHNSYENYSKGSGELIQRWDLARKAGFLDSVNPFLKSSRSLQPSTAPMLVVKREKPDSPLFTINVAGDDCRNLIEVCAKVFPARFGSLVKRIELTSPGMMQKIDAATKKVKTFHGGSPPARG